MDIIEEHKLANETLVDDPHKILNLGSENVVVPSTTTIVEKTEVSVVKMIQQDKDDILKNQQQGLFGNLVGGGEEGMKVNCSENGASLGMDVEGLLGGENGSEAEPVFEGNDENAPGDRMDVCLSGEKEKNGENGEGGFEFKEDTNKNDEGKDDENALEDPMDIFEWKDDTDKKSAENEEEYDEEQDESDDEEDEDHDFVVGDFVWGKIKSHPWWPGQIYDPSDASDYASTLKRKGRLLVAYFGDGSFSWCSPSQLKPFIDHFQEMSVQSDSKKFVNAVRKALEEVSGLVEAELMCKCQPVDRVKIGGVKNSGIKEGVCAPKGNTVRVLMDRMQPIGLVTALKDYATVDPGTRVLVELELTVLKSCLSAFYGQKGGYLSKYYEPKCIEGLEDETRSGSATDSDKNGPSESTENGDDKLYQRRKQKSVAELLGEDEPRIKKAKTGKDGGGSSKTKRKALVVSVTPESDHESGGVEEGTMSPRQRKRSKYLSPPYLSPIGGGKLSVLGSGSFKEPKTEPEKVPEMAAEKLEDSLKKSSGKRASQKRRVREGSDSKEHKIIDAALNVNKVLSGLLRAALDPSSFVEKNLPVITEFISSFRSSIFENESSHQVTEVKKDGSPATLVIEFPPEVALPTKAELLKTYKKSGELIKKETLIDGSRALVAFGNNEDAEAALAMSLDKKPFGDVNIKYHISDDASSVKTGPRKVAGEDMSDLGFIEQKLETMSEIVQRCEESEMSADVKASLEGEIKEVLEKVGKMRRK